MDYWLSALELEHRVAEIIAEQESNGVRFDIKKAEEYLTILDTRCNELYADIRSFLAKEVVPFRLDKGYYKRIFNADGSYSKLIHNYCDLFDLRISDIGGQFTPIKIEEPDLNKPQKLKEQLLRLGWKPTEWNYSKKTGELTSPKITEDSFDSIPGELGKDIKTWHTYKHRRQQICSTKNEDKGWLNNKRLKIDGRLTAGAIPCGTNTARMKHITVVNIPKAADHVIFGKEMRSLFIASEGYKIVGHDASGLELRMFAHYLNDPEYTEVLLNGDIHSYNQSLAGLPNRDNAKTFIYGFLYGAGDAKVGSIIGGTAKEGKQIKRRFFNRIPKLKTLIENVKRASNRGYLKGLDGRKIWMRRQGDGKVMEHKALNTLLQSAGAIVMKKSLVLLTDEARRLKIPYRKIWDMHDEGGNEVKNISDYPELFGQVAVQSIRDAGKHFNLNCPLDAEYNIGDNWAEVH